MSLFDNYYIGLLNDITVGMYRYGGGVIYILGNLGNLLSCLVFLRKPWKKNVCVIYFFTSLILSTIYLNSTILGTVLVNGFNINGQNSSIALCKLFFYVSFVSSTLLPTILICASVDRLLISSQNVDTRLYSSKRLAYFSISTSSFLWIIINTHTLVKVNLQEIYPSYFICYYDMSDLYVDFVSYFLTIFNTLTCIVMITLSMGTFKNIRHIRIATRRRRRSEIRSMTRKDFQLLRCLFVQNVLYSILSVSSSAYSIYKVATKYQIRTPLEQAIYDFLDNTFTFVYFIFYCTGIFIFVVVSKVFRHELKHMIQKIFGRDVQIMRGEVNQQSPSKQDDRPDVTILHNSITVISR